MQIHLENLQLVGVEPAQSASVEEKEALARGLVVRKVRSDCKLVNKLPQNKLARFTTGQHLLVKRRELKAFLDAKDVFCRHLDWL